MLIFFKRERMKFRIKKFCLLILIVPSVLTGCKAVSVQSDNINGIIGNQTDNKKNMNKAAETATEVKTDVEGLEKKINLPFRPVEVKWVEEFMDNSEGLVPGPSDYRLTALLKYDSETAERLVKQISADADTQPLGNTDSQDWFFDEVKSKIQTKDGRTYLEGTEYPPEAFFRPPYNNGKIIRLNGTNYFVLNLHSF